MRATHHLPKRPIRSIEVSDPYSHLQLDLVDMGVTPSGNRYVATLIDLFSKHAWTNALKSKRAGGVVSFISSVIQTHGRFPILQSDNGGEFVNSQLQALLKSHTIGKFSMLSRC
jgi:hypothetical protein